MIRILEAKPLPDQLLRLRFDDGTEKVIDLKPFIGSDELTRPLADPSFFGQVQLYPAGRGIFWPNEYDMCPDYLRYHAVDAQTAPVA